MKRFPRAALAATLALGVAAAAFGQDRPGGAEEPPPALASSLDGPLFYQLLLGELNASGSEPAAGYALILDAARRTNDPALYQRAIEIALQSRSGEAALQAARAWKQAQPNSREANRHVLQILLALNQLEETAEPLRAELAFAQAQERVAVVNSVPRLYARAADKKAAAALVEQVLAPALSSPALGPAAWSAIGRMRLAGDDTAGALEAARRAQALDARAEQPALLALELMDPKLPAAEAIVRRYMEAQPRPEVRMGYARALLDAQRYGEALQQMQAITAQRPELAEAWLVQGTLLAQDNQLAGAEAALKKYVELAQQQRADERNRGLAQAYMSLSQIAEKRKDYALANAWLDKIESSQDLTATQNRRASILARQGRVDEARQLIRNLPQRNPDDVRAKLMAEVNLLREAKQYQVAYDLLGAAAAQDPKDVDLVYDQAMMAEKLSKLGEMERLLRQVIAARPDYHHAYNALGYSLAERNIRLPEAKQLVQKALEFAPGDPFISDSLGWVEFRMGNRAEALRILEAAYKQRPDPEIAAHLGEVLWSLGQRERAHTVWREGLLTSSDNETLQETLKRLKVRP